MPTQQQQASSVTASILDLIAKPPTSRLAPSPQPLKDAQKIIRKAAWQSAGISGALAIPPGPLGMLTVLPDLLAIWRLQAQMVADIAALYGKTGYLTRESLLFCLFKHGSSQLFRDIIARVGERYVLRRTSLRTVQRIAEKLGLRVTQRVLGKSISRWIPVIGAVAVGLYARYDTQHVGYDTIDLFSRDIDSEENTERTVN